MPRDAAYLVHPDGYAALASAHAGDMASASYLKKKIRAINVLLA